MKTEDSIVEENERTPKKLILIGILILLLISAIVSVAYVEIRKSKSKTLEFINPTEKNFIKTKTVSGRVVPSHTETIYVDETKGSIQEILVKEGETITKGQKLFTYESSSVAAEIGQAEVNKKLAETSVSQSKEQITSLEEEIREAESTTTDTTDTTNSTDIAMNHLLQAELNSAKAELNAAELTVEKYSLQDEKLKAQLQSLTVSSNTAGVIQYLNQNVGQGFRVTGNQQKEIMQIASNEPFQIEGMLTETEKAKITLGQSITVRSKVVSNKKWKGKISEVSDYPIFKTSANKDNATQESIPYYSFKASVDSQESLYPGYNTTLDVVVISKQMLAVPNTSIKRSGNSTYVYVLTKGKIHKQKVAIGRKSGKWVAILKGIKKEDKIVEKPNWTVREGTKIDLK